jgi:hypothetical protein
VDAGSTLKRRGRAMAADKPAAREDWVAGCTRWQRRRGSEMTGSEIATVVRRIEGKISAWGVWGGPAEEEMRPVV